MSVVDKSVPLKIALAVGVIEVFAVVAYAISIGVLHLQQGTSGAVGSDVSPWFLITTYMGFAALILLVIWKLNSGSGGARTPYLVTQAFALVVAEALFNGAETAEVIGGWVLVALALVGAVAILNPAASRNLNIHK